ncbi:MAG: hypothetical protein M3N50_05405 [Pseudomonadota bacterium]|nr:hypothetical protein [Pseudomonadota bacterium]
MKFVTASLMCAAIMAFSSQVHADDSTSSTQQQNTMKECMARQKAKDSSMSEADMQAMCKKQVDMKKSGNDLTSAPPAPTPAK